MDGKGQLDLGRDGLNINQNIMNKILKELIKILKEFMSQVRR